MLNTIFKHIGLAVLRTFDFLVATFTANKEVLDENDFPFNQMLRDNYPVFLKEYNLMLSQNQLSDGKDFYKIETDLHQEDNWKAAPIVLFGYVLKESANTCPETFKIVSQLPGCQAAMFLSLGAGKHVPPHSGIYKGIYRCLLTLQVQENADCWIRVNKQKIYFKTGETVVFDETVEHEVMNASSAPRVVLYLDFYRRLPFPLNVLNYIVFNLLRKSPFVATILNEYKKQKPTEIEEFNAPPAVLR